MYPMILNIEQKLTTQLLKGYPNLRVKFDTKDFLKGDPVDQMNLVVAGVNSGILTPNEAREALGYQILVDDSEADELRVSQNAGAQAHADGGDSDGKSKGSQTE